MASDAPVVHIGENSPEYVAYLMMKEILIIVEDKTLGNCSRTEYLDTYMECLQAVRERR